MAATQPTVLFLCADNSVRSQLGEVLFRHRAGDRFEVESAGLSPKPVHPLVSEVLREVGLDTDALSSKRIGPILGKRSVRYAVILRDTDEAQAPRIFPFATRTLRWDVEDPTAAGAGEETLERFRRVRDEIDAHVREWVRTIDATERHPSTAA